jgi:hypothetical protein
VELLNQLVPHTIAFLRNLQSRGLLFLLHFFSNLLVLSLLFVRAFGLGIILPVPLRLDPFHFSNRNSQKRKKKNVSDSTCENGIFLHYSWGEKKPPAHYS